MPIPPLPFHTLHDLFRAHAAQHGTRPAIGNPQGRWLTWADLLAQCERFHRAFRQRGIGRNQRVILVAEQGFEAAVAILAVAASATCIPINPELSRDDGVALLDAIRGEVLLAVGPGHTGLTALAADRGISIWRCLDPLGDEPLQGQTLGTPSSDGWMEADDMVLILCSSGSTGHPKLIPHWQTEWLQQCWDYAAALGLTADDHCLNALAHFHSAGVSSGVLVP